MDRAVSAVVLGDAFIRKVRIDLYGTGDEAFVQEIVSQRSKHGPKPRLKQSYAAAKWVSS